MSEIKCYFEAVTGIIRAGPEADEFGKPFQFSCTVLIDGDKAFLKGASGKFDRSTLKAISKCLKDIGIETMSWDKKNNKERAIERKTG